ncbi:MAG: molybdenum cofactor guanylyltransferase [bacterium]
MNCYILAGGQSKRFGQNKALYALDTGETLLERVIAIIPASIKAIKLVTNSPEDYRFLTLPMLPDVHPGLGPISGVHAGLVDSQHQLNFFLACDLPMISTDFIERILAAHSGQDIFGIKTAKGYEPLCTIYSKNCIPKIETLLAAKEYSLQALFEAMPSEFIEVPNSEVLFNLNTIHDLQALKKLNAQ